MVILIIGNIAIQLTGRVRIEIAKGAMTVNMANLAIQSHGLVRIKPVMKTKNAILSNIAMNGQRLVKIRVTFYVYATKLSISRITIDPQTVQMTNSISSLSHIHFREKNREIKSTINEFNAISRI
ncbi:uncharacterized protein LOC144428320 isoform X1 [Styela clava]